MTRYEEDELVRFCQRLIRAKSYSGDESLTAIELSDFFTKNGFDVVEKDELGNVIGIIKGSKPGKTVLFDGHIDTVPVGDEAEWMHHPFSAEIQDGRIYGRGASDMKGAVAAMAFAAALYAKENKGDFAGEICVAGVVHEECFEGIAARCISKRLKPDFVVIGESTDLKLSIGQKGRAEIKIETFGIPAHSANPDKGINAVYKMTKVIEALNMLEVPEHTVLGKGIFELTDIKSSPYPGASVVPEYCTATYDRRLLIGETKETVLKPILELIESLESIDPQLKVSVSYSYGEEECYTGEIIRSERYFPAWLNDKEEQFICDIMRGMANDGICTNISHYDFCTNGSHYAGEAGIRTIGYGPSKENLAHTVDEYIEIDQLIKASNAYQSIIKALLV